MHQRGWAFGLLLAATLCAAQAQNAQTRPNAETAPRYQLQLEPEPGAPEAAGGSVQFIGTATVLIRYRGLTILTDPNFLHKGEHVHLGYGLQAQRLTQPAIGLEALPPVDLVLLSHFHEDHFDRLVQQKLDRNIPVASTAHAVQRLRDLGFSKLYPLATWDALQVRKGGASLRLTSLPGRHGPLPVSLLLPPVMGAMLDFADGKGGNGGAKDASYRIYVSGDTMVHDDIQEIPRRFPGADLAILHLGGTRLLGLVTVTMDAADGLRMLQLIAPAHAIPIHYNDYDVFKSPLSDFQRAVEQAGLAGKVSYLKHGEIYQFSQSRE